MNRDSLAHWKPAEMDTHGFGPLRALSSWCGLGHRELLTGIGGEL